MKKNKLSTLVITGLMSACCFMAFRYLKISAPFTIHLGNVFCLLTSLLIGGINGGICGAIGMGIGDLLDPRYVITFPKTVICKMVMALTAGYFGHKVFKINETHKKKDLFTTLLISVLVNCVFELGFGYIYYRFILKTIGDTFGVFLASKLVSNLVTSTITLIVTYIIYFPIYNRIKSYL